MLAQHRKYFSDITSVSDYYPFGSKMYGRRWSAGYRFGFNGKENDNEVMGNGNFQDYGARMYDTRLGRFISADPIIINEHKYTFYSPYQFASNTPIQAKDLDGLEAFFIHGTWSDPSTWKKESITQIKTATENKTDVLFQWSGYNTSVARYAAAWKLVKEIMYNRNPDEPLTLVGHSHGGNVAILAANILYKQFNIKVDNLITINSPVRKEYLPIEGAVSNHFNVYTDIDIVQKIGGNSFAILDEIKSTEPIDIDGRKVRGLMFINEGRYIGTGEVGFAGRTFKNAKNIFYEDKEGKRIKKFYKELGHVGHLPRNVKNWTPQIKNSKSEKNEKSKPRIE